jgi:hypothetical protein
MFNPFVFIWYVLQLITPLFTFEYKKQSMQYVALVDSNMMDILLPLQSNSSPYYLHTKRLTYNLREQIKQNPSRRSEFLAWKENNDMLFNMRMAC